MPACLPACLHKTDIKTYLNKSDTVTSWADCGLQNLNRIIPNSSMNLIMPLIKAIYDRPADIERRISFSFSPNIPRRVSLSTKLFHHLNEVNRRHTGIRYVCWIVNGSSGEHLHTRIACLLVKNITHINTRITSFMLICLNTI